MTILPLTPETKKPTSRHFAADIIRILATLAIISVHVYYPLYSRPNYFGGLSWWYAQTVSIFGHLGVPLFLLLSGYLNLAPKSNLSLKSHLLKTWRRLGLPLLFWTTVYLIWDHHWNFHPFTLHHLFTAILEANAFHLYFLFILINLYLLTPIIQPFLKQPTIVRYLLTLSLITTIGTGLASYLTNTQVLYTSFTIGLPYLSYYLLGHLLRSHSFSARDLQKLIFVFISLLFFTVVTSARNLQLFAQHDTFLWRQGGNQYFTDYLSLNILILSVITFIFLLRLPQPPALKFPRLHSLITQLSLATYGMYLIHPIVIDYLDVKYLMIIHLVTSRLWLHITQKMFLVTSISFTLAFIARRLPLIKRLFGEVT